MTRRTHQWQQWVKLPLAVAVAAGMSGQASAYSFYMGDVEASLNTTLSAGATWRTTHRDERLIAEGNLGPEYAPNPTSAGPNPASDPNLQNSAASSNNFDDGNLNFNKGDTVSKIVKGNTDLFLNYSVDSDTLTRVGGFVRGRYYYDFELKDESRQRRELNSKADDNASGADLLDAYVFSDWYFGNVPVSLRYGKQVISWGESTFIQGGINTINPVDVPAFRAPGSELKDALLPVEMFYVSAGITENITVEGFVQTDWEPVKPDDCGTFFSTNDFAADGCGPVILASSAPQEFYLENNAGLALRAPDKDADTKDQFGVAVRWYVPELNDSELGFYYIKYNSRLPLVSGTVGDSVGQINDYFIEYPENIDLYGISINTTTPGGWSLGAEYSFRDNVPVQWSSFELILGGLQIVDSEGPLSLLQIAREKEAGVPVGSGQLSGESISGYDLYNVSQAQMTLIKFFDQVMGASRLSFISEVGATYVHDLPGYDEARYGRSGTFGIGTIPRSSGRDACLSGSDIPALNNAGANSNSNYCNNEGYTTSFSWGYRARLVWSYPNALAGVNLSPQLAWSHDVDGYAPQPAGNFIEDRKAIGVSLEAVYQNSITGNIGYTNFMDGEPFNELTDRDFVSASVSYSF
ncbi:DUF1302 domain-containing protein [Marinobacter sp. CHS3-4]|uniref:DUF1302 domain-containing protein n=1 Tax=Marinobacter sp. CHS3-4 TaxID=3045174 RepID=UPI0024B53B3B|nr:DUF1302 domain-containing protein [Marinobacter sp. CHS3-4]MDI9244948.1 DUF1302 domain-containing protein [Marinobacter sp. CHS3-4]